MSVLHCAVCTESIPVSDFAHRLAVTVLKKHYCRVCCDTISTGGRRNLRDGTSALRVRGSAILAAAVGSLALLVLLCLFISRR